MVIMNSETRNRVSRMALALQVFIMLKGAESQVTSSSSSSSVSSSVFSVSPSKTPLLSSTLTTTAATPRNTLSPSVTLLSSSAESQITTSSSSVSYASVTVTVAVTTSAKPSSVFSLSPSKTTLLSSTLTTTAATPGNTLSPSVTLLSPSAESQITTSSSSVSYASVTVTVAVTTSAKPSSVFSLSPSKTTLLSSTLTTTAATPGNTLSPSVTLLSPSAESQITTSSSSVSYASVTVTVAVTTSAKPSSVFSLSPSKTTLLSSTLTTTVTTPGITLSPSVTLSSSSTPQTPELTKSSLGISPSLVLSDVKPTDPTTSVAETTPSSSPTSALFSSSPVSSTSLPQKPQKPSIYIKTFFSIPWGRFCYLTSLFKESLSRNLLEFEGVIWHYMPLKRIRLYNAKEKCANKTLYYNKDAILELFIARTGEENNTDVNKTIEAFKLLHGYWTNKRMILLDPVFEGKVTKVVLVGDDEDKYIDEYTEAQRIGIAIGVALAVLVVILIIIYCRTRGRRNIHQARRRKPVDGKMVITNEHAFEESTASDLKNAASKPLETQEDASEVPEQVVVHKQPSPTQTKKSEVDVKEEDKTPLLSMIKDYEDGKSGDETTSDQETNETEAAVETKPEPEKFDGRPIKPPRSDSMIDAEIVFPEPISPIGKVLDTEEQVKNEEEGTESGQTEEESIEPSKKEEEGTEPGKNEEEGTETSKKEEEGTEPGKNEEEGTEPSKNEEEGTETSKKEEEGKEERRLSFTSSVTVHIRPEAATISKESNSPAKEQPQDTQTGDNNQAPTDDDDISEQEKVKPDFGQSDSDDADPNEGAINLGFDDDEAQKEETKKEEETKF